MACLPRNTIFDIHLFIPIFMKKLLFIGLALVGMLSANAQDKEVKYSYPFATTTSHEYPATSSNSSYGTQNNILDLNGVGNAKTTLYAYTDGTYKIAAWCGVEGYDLDFSLADDGTITVLNENAEYKQSKGYWKVPTGLETYDRIQVFANKVNNNGDLRSEIKVSETQATVNLRYNSYVWETGNNGNASVMATYYGRGFAGTPTKYSVQEAAWDDATSDYVTTYDLNTQKTSVANVYSLGDNKYVATDWMGENTGDLYFTVNENDSIIVDDIANLCAESGFWYYYNVNLANDGIEPVWGGTYNDGTSYALGFWYGTDAASSDSYVYRYYFLEPLTNDVVLGDWYESSKYIYYGGAENEQKNNPVTISSVEGNTVTISGLLNSETYGGLSDVTATLDIANRTVTINPQTISWDGYDWTLANTTGESNAVIGTISEDYKTINIDELNIYYYGWSYFDESTITLTRDKVEEEVLEPSAADAICGDWFDNGTFDYYNSDPISITNAPVTITKTAESTVKIKGLFLDPAYPTYGMGNVVATVDMDAKTITVDPQEVSWYGYSWTLANLTGESDNVVGTISDDNNTITIDGLACYYYGSPAQTYANQTLTRETVATGIKNVTNTVDNAIYNLNGVRMNNASLTKGVYVQNGKKFIVK